MRETILKNLINYLFLSLASFYFVFLIFRIVSERLPRDPVWFLLIYVLFVGFPLIIKFFIITVLPKLQSNSEKGSETSKGWLKMTLSVIFEKFTSQIIKIRELFIKDFFTVFLGENLKIRLVFFYIVKLFEKLIFYADKLIFLFILIPWFIFLISLIIEVLNKDFFFYLYIFFQ